MSKKIVYMSAKDVQVALAALVKEQSDCVSPAQQDAVFPPARIREVHPIALKTNTAENPCSTGADSSAEKPCSIGAGSSVDNPVAAENNCCTIS